MTEMQNAIRAAIAHAAESQGPAVVVAMAEGRIAEARRDAITSAEKQGVQVRIMPTVVHIDDGREKWPSTLAEMLCEQTALASTPNDELMRLVSERLGLNVQLSGNRLSKDLSSRAKQFVHKVLAEHGFDGAGVEKGTDIKRVVKNNLRLNQENKCSISTMFEADGIVLDGRKYQYRLRERTATGLPWNDFCIRMSGSDVPLMAVLTLRGINLGSFKAADDAVCKRAGLDAAQRRGAITRAPGRQSRTKHNHELLRASAEADENFGGSEHARMARLWWDELSPTKRESASYWAMVRFVNGIAADPVKVGDALERLDEWVEQYRSGGEQWAEGGEEPQCQD